MTRSTMSALRLDVFTSKQIFQLFLEFADIFEVSVDAGEADVGDRVDVLEAVHDEFAYRGGGAFAALGVDDEGFGGVDNFLHLGDGDLAFLARMQQAGKHFLPVEAFAASVFF